MRMRKRCGDYLAMGVPEVWIFDPEERSAFVLTTDGMREQKSGTLTLRSVGVHLDLASIFAVLGER